METMNIAAKKGTKVIYLAKNGYDYQLEKANNYLEKNKEYTVERTEIDGWHTDVYLQEFTEVNFNSVHFTESINL